MGGIDWDMLIEELAPGVETITVESAEFAPLYEDVNAAVMTSLDEFLFDLDADYELELDWEEAIEYNQRFDEAHRNLNTVQSVMFFLERVLPKCPNS